jgi:hypothetical protein
MSQSRLFITGDSWTRWYRPYHHWVRYLKNHYEVFNYGKAGLNNYEIITTLHNLPPYKSGDRLVIFFTHCSRVPLSYYGDYVPGTIDKPFSRSHFKNKKLFTIMEEIRDQETERWISGERSNEVNFIKYLKDTLYKQYDPIFLTWSEVTSEPLGGYVDYMDVSTNYEEGLVIKNSNEVDLHPGPRGCYDIYKHLYNKLPIKDSLIDFKEEPKTVI